MDRQDIAGVDKFASYGYDPAGNITSISDVSRSGTDTQCFTYDYLRRLTEGWTQDEKACAGAPAKDHIAGPAPFWQSYAYDKAGNRTARTDHAPGGDTTKETKTNYTYAAPDGRSHTLCCPPERTATRPQRTPTTMTRQATRPAVN
ncbi:hypothetical protein AB0D04_27840 [Streptomyces sp. NPDC048483]|uniref:hypothetical protein n=1 Tax=Streptomyces sp. NPDC048483 TaxID=3154927 RepID=UPI0034238547